VMAKVVRFALQHPRFRGVALRLDLHQFIDDFWDKSFSRRERGTI